MTNAPRPDFLMRAAQTAHAKYERSTETAERCLALRNQAISALVARGDRPADIARALGLTRSRITQIANGSRPKAVRFGGRTRRRI